MNKVFYLCDQKKCEMCSGKLFGQCYHTSDETHAKNPDSERKYKEFRGDLIEVTGKGKDDE